MAFNAQSAIYADPTEASLPSSKEAYLTSQLIIETSRLNILQLQKEKLILENVAPKSKKAQLKNDLSLINCFNYYKKEIPHQVAKITLLQEQLKNFYNPNEQSIV